MKKGNSSKGVQFKTLAQVQQSITKRQPYNNRPNPRIDHYLKCVFKPFESLGHGTLRPDSASNKIILRDILQAYDVYSPSGFGIKISPMYPYCVSWWPTTGGLTVNQSAVPVGYVGIPAGFTAQAGKADADFAGAAGTPSMTDYEKARIQTIGWRLVYTGKPVDAQGYYLIDNASFQVDVTDRQVPPTCTYYGAVTGTSVNYAAGTSCAYATVESPIFFNGGSFQPVSPTQTSRLYRPEEGAHGVLKRSAYSPNHQFKPIWNGGIAVLDHRVGDPNVTNCWIGAPRPGTFAGNTIIDDDFDSTMIYVSSAGLYRLEVVVCLEAVVLQASALEPLAKASPALEQQTLEQESRVMATLPPAAPLRQPVIDNGHIMHEPSVPDQLTQVKSDIAETNRRINNNKPKTVVVKSVAPTTPVVKPRTRTH